MEKRRWPMVRVADVFAALARLRRMWTWPRMLRRVPAASRGERTPSRAAMVLDRLGDWRSSTGPACRRPEIAKRRPSFRICRATRAHTERWQVRRGRRLRAGHGGSSLSTKAQAGGRCKRGETGGEAGGGRGGGGGGRGERDGGGGPAGARGTFWEGFGSPQPSRLAGRGA